MEEENTALHKCPPGIAILGLLCNQLEDFSEQK